MMENVMKSIYMSGTIVLYTIEVRFSRHSYEVCGPRIRREEYITCAASHRGIT